MRHFEIEKKITDLEKEIHHWFMRGPIMFDYFGDGSMVHSNPKMEELKREVEKLEKLRDRENSMSEWG